MLPERDPLQFSRRQYMLTLLATKGANFFESIEAVASVALDHPEWDMEETKTWESWENRNAEE